MKGSKDLKKSLEFTIERRILKIGNEINNGRIEYLSQYDLTTSQSETLLFFDSNEGASATELKEHLNISHQAARNYVERLKLKGLICSEISENDGRAKKIKLTSEGQDVCNRLKNEGHNVGEELLKDFSLEDKETLLKLLNKIH